VKKQKPAMPLSSVSRETQLSRAERRANTNSKTHGLLSENAALREALCAVILAWDDAGRWPDTNAEMIALETAIGEAREALK